MFRLPRSSRGEKGTNCCDQDHGYRRDTSPIRRLWRTPEKKDQDIAVVDIDPDKLMRKLHAKYGEDFQIHVRHDIRFGLLNSDQLTAGLTDDAQCI